MISVITPTHDPRHLRETCESLLAQTFTDWEWIVAANGGASIAAVHRALGAHHDDSRIRAVKIPSSKAIGAIKRAAFALGLGDVLVELDHDDLLTPDALAEIYAAFGHDQLDVDFVYSNFADILEDGTSSFHGLWEANGFRYRTTSVGCPLPCKRIEPPPGHEIIAEVHEIAECVAFAPSAATMSLIYYAPNHVRAWRRAFYERIGGHDPSIAIADDHDLLIRTYLEGRMRHVDRCLYLYRMGGQNTFAARLAEIRRRTYELHARYIERLLLREGELRDLPCYDLGGAIGCPPGWKAVDRVKPYEVYADLSKPWPFADSSVLAFRAHDIIEHVADKEHFMAELHRCLVPGGWAMINVPSTDGRGAFQDPTHVSFWNENSFWYWTRPEQAAYIRNEDMFMIRRLFTWNPSDWHKQHNIPYVVAELQAFKGDMTGIPGVRP